jgi:segregation and condensation protein B
MDTKQLKYIVEAALLAAGRPLDLNELLGLFGAEHPPEKKDIKAALAELEADYADRGIQVQEVASGYRIQIRSSAAGWLGRLWEERTPRYSRALMETLAIIAYRQPVTRGDVEDIRGVGVTTNIMRTLLERNWIRVVGFRDVPGRPAMYGTTKEFLDYFGLKKLDDLPPLAELKDMEAFNAQLDLGEEAAAAEAGSSGGVVESLHPVASAELANDDAANDAGGDAADDAGGAPDEPVSPELSAEDDPGEPAVASNVIPLKAR